MSFFFKLITNCLLLVILFLWSSCANWGGHSGNSRIEFNKAIYRLTDPSGETRLVRERGMSKGEKFTVKRLLSPLGNNENILERSISISSLGRHKNGFSVLVPERSQFQVWFEGRRYFSDLKVELDQNRVVTDLRSPVKRWNGRKEAKLYGKTAIYCFFSQLIECVRVTGFMEKAVKSGLGEMNFYVIWDGYPYLQEHLGNVKAELVSVAKFNMEGVNKRGITSFNLEFGGQVIFFHVDKAGSLVKMFWVSQGISLVRESSVE